MLDLLIFLVPLTLAAVTSILSLEEENPLYSILSFTVASISVGVAFFAINSPILGVFQLLIYAGAVSVLFITVLHLLGIEEIKYGSFKLAIPLVLLLAVAIFLASNAFSFRPIWLREFIPFSQRKDVIWIERSLDLMMVFSIIFVSSIVVSYMISKYRGEIE